MTLGLWEFGILLIGIGFLMIAINLSITIKSFDRTVKKVEKIVDENEKSLKDILSGVGNITQNVDGIMSIARSATSFISGFKLVSKFIKNSKNRRIRNVTYDK